MCMDTLLTLDLPGLISALVLGLALILLGGELGLGFLAVMLYFLVLSAMVTWTGKGRKKRLGLYETSRGWRNVAANGGVPLMMALFFFANAAYAFVPQGALIASYVASVAAITADKFASEIGVLGGEPIMLLTLRRTKRGTSGGVTALGLGASLLGSALIAASVFALPGLHQTGRLFLVVLAAGFVGNLADSAFGYFEEKGIGNKYTSNAACAVVGAIIAVLLA